MAPQNDKPDLELLISAHDFEPVASRTFTPKAWAFVSSAATDLHTKTRNSSAYASIGLRPRALRNVAHVDTSAAILGSSMRMPIFCSPTAMAKLVHEEGEKDIGRACKESGIAQCVSMSASYPLQDIAKAIDEHSVPPSSPLPNYQVPLFFQLYVDKNRDNSKRLLQQAQRTGVKGVLLTIDAPVPGKREADERIPADETMGSLLSGAKAGNDSKGGAIGRSMGGYIDASFSWADIDWVRECVPGLPIILKGIQTYEDALLARQAGVDAIIVSNHGGRSLDTSPATIMVLLELRQNCPEIFESMEVYVDGGISRGTDIFKALCLGAKAVGIGRGCLYSLNYGREGVARYIEILRDELETTMKMCGVISLDQLHPGYLNTLAVDHLIPRKHMYRDIAKSRL
ncbi:Cytochrome b2-like protein [Paramyrothecium foliicola]|nr:Cytochrome b2-like protein [Paramyrothecium foliicola]